MAADPEEKHPHIPGRQFLDRVVLGGSDGMIESVALTAALNGATVSSGTIIIAGFGLAVAGGISMFFSAYLSRRSELDSLRMDMERERMEIETEPEEEKHELEGLLRKEGYLQNEVDVIMGRLVRDKEMWLRAQLAHELKLHVEELETDPFSRSAFAGIAFMACALAALTPYAFGMTNIPALGASIGVAVVILFALGAKVFTLRTISFAAGFESAAVGVIAAMLLYFAGGAIARI